VPLRHFGEQLRAEGAALIRSYIREQRQSWR
jgi:hypothetical protein